MIKRTFVWLSILAFSFAVTTGCDSGPGVASEEESIESMEETMNFDPMEATQESTTPAGT